MLNQDLAIHVLISNREKKLLVIKRSSSDENDPDMWDIPGGGIDKREGVEEGIVREAREESGLEIENIEIIGAYTIDDDSLQLLARADYKFGKVKLSAEHSEYKWVNVDEILRITLAGLHLKAAQSILKKKKRIVLYPKY